MGAFEIIVSRVMSDACSDPEGKGGIRNRGWLGAVEDRHGPVLSGRIEAGDGPSDIDYLARKICSIRIFDDENGVMNLDVSDISGEILLHITVHPARRCQERQEAVLFTC